MFYVAISSEIKASHPEEKLIKTVCLKGSETTRWSKAVVLKLWVTAPADSMAPSLG